MAYPRTARSPRAVEPKVILRSRSDWREAGIRHHSPPLRMNSSVAGRDSLDT
ncbi:hypothetical protein SCATT_44150 [Streptantibioticus cattleyicolor NRRL 8057 = DSM 46488]|uniref:Uncharacterized protein n=1 Tax=Streptantibioticus cattleyicolor (strain ATCC 35852 / DSM 46488 / JCM 4925 / NBRC 14057 / NRRL 8057) TaxID=1003195 RepID=G8WV18_STREN|nr:hypothetical protein SCATT_44150 [Streptantibioticus cattleyicolor NRRL 8057 = DSM 46488]